MTDRADPRSVASDGARAIGAGLGFLVVALAYDASAFGDRSRWWAAGASIVLGAVLADAVVVVRSRLSTPGLAPLPIVGALVAIGLCVPETDQLAVAAAPTALLLIGEVVGRRQLTVEWYAVAVFAAGWGGLFGATGRQSALAGALFACWALVLPLLIVLITRTSSARSIGVASGLGAVAAVVMARTGGIADDGWAVIVVSMLVCGAVSFCLAWLVARRLDAATTSPR